MDLLGGGNNAGAAASASATAAAQAAAAAQSQAAQQAAQHSIDMLGRTSQAIQAMRSAQDAARALAAQTPTYVPNGLNPGGLVVDPRVGTANGANLWVNAGAPTQTTGGDGKVTVTIEQQAQRAVMTWQEFNVGRDTTVYFDQRAGNSSTGNNWIAYNRIDATGVPSQILGQIRAEGTVVLINPNGVIFNGTSQINVHSLIAAAMDMNSFAGSATGAFKASGPAYVPIFVDSTIFAPSDEANANKTFLDNGLFINSGFLLPGTYTSTGSSALFSAGTVPGQTNAGVQVQAGARITTDVSGSDNGGFVALLGPQVTNAGSIETKAGSIILAAGSSALIAEPASGSTQTGYAVRTSGNGFPFDLLYSPPPVTEVARAVNDGLLVSSRGNITLIGDAVEQLGIAEATTSITRAGSITIAANGGEVLFGQSSLTTILPEHNGETIPSDAASLANFIAPRIDVSAQYVDFQSGSLVYAPSATMTVTGPGMGPQSDGSPPLPVGRVLMEAGSTIDLSGLTAYRSVADYIYTFKVTGNDVADTPLAQSLIGETVTIDLSLTGTRADGETWVGSPLFASSGAGYLANVSQGIDQLLTKGGTLNFNPGYSIANGQTTPAFTDVLQAPGAVVNISGGTVQYTGAAINTTQLIGSDGRTYDIGSADPLIAYQGFAGTYTVNHPRWDYKDVYANHLYSGSYYKAGHTNGLSAGALNVTAVNPILEGDLVGDIVIGAQQRQLAATAKGADGKPVQLTPDQLPIGASLSIALAASAGSVRSVVVLQDTTSTLLGDDFTFASSLTLPSAGTLDGYNVPLLGISTKRLSEYNLGSITISGADSISVSADASLSVRAGGRITLSNVTNIDGTLTAHGGDITISGASLNTFASWQNGSGADQQLPSLVLGAQALLDVSGQWINDTGHYAAEDFAGALYIDGGSVSLRTAIQSKVLTWDQTNRVVTAEDRSPSIVLAKGSIIDVSSGGYVGTNGRLKVGSDGLPAGKGGNVSLATYNGTWQGVVNVNPSYFLDTDVTYAPTVADHGNVVMDGTIYAGGLSQGGTFSLQVPTVVIDGQATKVTSITTGDQGGTVVLPPSFFTDSGFSSYKLTSTYGSTTVTGGTTVNLKQQNYLAASMVSLPDTGARVREFAALGYAPDGMRHAVDLALTQSSYDFGTTGGRAPTAQLLIDEGASIVADPKANITLTAGGPAVILGSITAHGGSIGINEGFTPLYAPKDGFPQYVWIGENAVLDVSGTFVPNPLVATYSTGTALAGGSISLSSTGVIIAQSGSSFDISGTSGTIEVPNASASLGSPLYATRSVWSNGGSLSLGGVGMYFAGTIDASGGAAEAAGGTLTIGASVGGLLISQSGDVSAPFAGALPPTTRSQLAALQTTTGTSYITADTINSSGIDTVKLGGGIYLSGDVHLKLPGSLVIDDALGALTLLPDGVTRTNYSAPACTPAASCIRSIGATNVTLEAGYIRFANSSGAAASSLNLPTLADGTLTLKAREQIDLSGMLTVNNASTVNLVSGGDIRLIGGAYNFAKWVSTDTEIASVVSDGYGGMPYAGGLLVADNLNLTARTIYPATDTAYLLMSRSLAPAGAAGTHNTITIASNGEAPVAPLSAGGAIIVDAKTIVQGGALYAPLGTIQLGFGSGQTLPSIFINGATNNPYNPVRTTGYSGLFGYQITTVTTDRVELLPGSVTSVSANGLMIPYGTTTDGVWSDNSIILNGPPPKQIVLGGARIDAQVGAIIDGSGGGDVYATEFVPGTGGSRNVLLQYNTVYDANGTATEVPLYPDKRPIYALVPGYSSALAAYDPSFTGTVAAGTTVTLPGGNGIPAGTYTLLPGQYATLPGAYRVVITNANASPYAQTFTTADGSVYMTGVLGNAINGSSSSQTALLQIQSNDVWTKYSQIDIATGNSYFAQLAATKGTALARLAQDAARITITAGTSLALNSTNLFDPAAGGLGGQLDITGTNLVVAASDRLGSFGTVANGVFTPNSTYAGYLFLDADMLSGLGIESTLVGGFRSSTSEGTLITATALNLEIATDAAHALTGPELLFTSLAPTSANPSARGLIVDDGSVITATGAVSGSSSSALVFGADPVATLSNGIVVGWSAGVSGDGALLRVSNAALVDVIRHFVPGVYKAPAGSPAPTLPVSTIARGNLIIGNNVALSGKSLTLDSSGATSLSTSASLTANNYDLAGGIVNLGGGSGGLVVTTDLIGKLAGADAVRLRSGSVFNLYGSNSFGDGANRIGTLTLDGAGLYSDGGTTTITAGNIVLANSQTTANTNGANTSGSGGRLALDASGTLTFGKGTKTLSGFDSVTATAGTEVLFTGNGSLDAKGANVALTAPLLLADKAASQTFTTTGLLSLAQGAGTARAIDPTIIGGSLSFTASSIRDSARLIAQGGKLTLEATTGDLELSGDALLSTAGTRITIGDLIQDTPAGSIRLFADAGNVTLGSGTTVDVSGAGSGYAGSLTVYANKTATLAGRLKGGARYSDIGGEFALIADQLVGALPLDSGFTRSFQVSLGHGDIAIGAGQTLKSENVLLVANAGGITVDGTIDASSASGGTIGLYGAGTSTAAAGTSGASGVTIGSSAKLYARYQAPDKDSPGYADGTATNVQTGGTITLGTTGTPDGTLDPTYGYQNVQRSGAITVASGAIFDVSGGPGGDSIDNTGGSVVVRAPILTNHTANVSFNGTIRTNAKADGSPSGRGLVANAFAVWSTTDSNADPAKHFDGVIDPAGFFGSNGAMVDGTWQDVTNVVTSVSITNGGSYATQTPPTVTFSGTSGATGQAILSASKGFTGATISNGGTGYTSVPTVIVSGGGGSGATATAVMALATGALTVVSSGSGYEYPIATISGSATDPGRVEINMSVTGARITNGGSGYTSAPEVTIVGYGQGAKATATVTNGVVTGITITSPGSGYIVPANIRISGGGGSGASAVATHSIAGVTIYDWGKGMGYTSVPTLTISDYRGSGSGAVVSGLSLQVAKVNVVTQGLGYTAAPTLSFSGAGGSGTATSTATGYYVTGVTVTSPGFSTGTSASVSFSAGTGNVSAAGSVGMGVGTVTTGTVSGGVRTVTGVGAADPNTGFFTPDTAYAPHVGFYQNTLVDFVRNFTVGVDFSGARLIVGEAEAVPLPASMQHLSPEIDLVNPSTTTNAGNITVASNWNLGAGSFNSDGVFAPAYRTATGEPGVLTLRAVNNVRVNATISDGFYETTDPFGGSALVANTIANNPQLSGKVVYNTTSSAGLMSIAPGVNDGSFSFKMVAGAANVGSSASASAVDPTAVVWSSPLSPTVAGSVTIDGHTSYIDPSTIATDGRGGSLVAYVPTLVRTGTGSISIAAAGDFALLDQIAPGAIYTAGYVAENADGFSAPALRTASTKYSGLVTTPVWATGGGDLTVRAGRDIVGIETPVDTGRQYSNDGSSGGVSTGQFWSAWYYVNGQSNGSSVAPFDPANRVSVPGVGLVTPVQYSSWINYGTFFQGFGALGGGDITLQAGRNVKDVSASLPETIQVSGGQSSTGPAAVAHYYGGGNLLVEAGNDVLSGVYYVGRGAGLIRAGGAAVSDATVSRTQTGGVPSKTSGQFSVPLLLAVQDSQISVQAVGDITLGGVFQPTRIRADYKNDGSLPANIGAAFDSFAANSGVSFTSSAGSITLNTLQLSASGPGDTDTLFTHKGIGSSPALLVPPNFSVVAPVGDISLPPSFGNSASIRLYPSATGEFSLVAGGTISGGTLGPASVKMYDVGEIVRVDGLELSNVTSVLGSPLPALTAPLHAGDDVPVIIYAGKDILGGTYNFLKPARLYAGRDILNVNFTGMNTSEDDVTSIVAGRDILANLLPDVLGRRRQSQSTSFTLYGPGDFVIEAGRDLGPFNSYSVGSGGGIFAVGNGANGGGTVKPYLPLEGADVTARYGVGGGTDYAGAIAKYGDAATAASTGIDIVSGIIPDLEKLLADLIAEQAKASGIANPSVTVTLTPAEAADLFTSLTTLAINGKLSALAEKAGLTGLNFDLTPTQFLSLIQAQEAMKVRIDRGFLGLLAQVGLDYKDVNSPYYGQYARAYDAIATLYPASLGYTDNSGGGSGAAPVVKHTGDLRMARSLVETQTGGDINILGPGGNLYVGSNRLDNLSPSQQGILTLQGGAVRTYTDGSVLIYQSRVFTEQGGNIEMFSANGDLNAGKGPKSSAAYPPLRLICDVNGYCRVSPAGLVTGAGIGALLSVPGQDPKKSNVILSAPHGVIDFGAAGLRSAGDLSVIAPVVLNAFNAQVGGTATGVPTFQAPDVGGMTQASNTSAGAVSDVAGGAGQQAPSEQPSIIIVEVIGYGGGDDGPEPDPDDKERKGGQKKSENALPSYNAGSPVRILGVGPLTDEEKLPLSADEKKRVTASGSSE